MNNQPFRIFFGVCLLLLVNMPAYAGDKSVQEFSQGLKVGDRIPDFALPDQNDTARDFKSLTGPKGLVIVFHRSADW